MKNERLRWLRPFYDLPAQTDQNRRLAKIFNFGVFHPILMNCHAVGPSYSVEMKVGEWNSADESNHDFGNKRNSLIF